MRMHHRKVWWFIFYEWDWW